jgi:hypothetical protein
MPIGYYREVTQILSRLGYRYLTTKRHEVWVNSAGHKLTVPFNLKSRHTANAILKDAGADARL